MVPPSFLYSTGFVIFALNCGVLVLPLLCRICWKIALLHVVLVLLLFCRICWKFALHYGVLVLSLLFRIHWKFALHNGLLILRLPWLHICILLWKILHSMVYSFFLSLQDLSKIRSALWCTHPSSPLQASLEIISILWCNNPYSPLYTFLNNPIHPLPITWPIMEWGGDQRMFPLLTQYSFFILTKTQNTCCCNHIVIFLLVLITTPHPNILYLHVFYITLYTPLLLLFLVGHHGSINSKCPQFF